VVQWLGFFLNLPVVLFPFASLPFNFPPAFH
jgi:hypothetical protein